MYRIAEILSDPTSGSDLGNMVSKAGDVLRLLTNVVEPLRRDGALTYHVDQGVQDRLIRAVHDKLVALLAFLSNDSVDGRPDPDQAGSVHTCVFLARVLQFDLGLSGAWTPEMKTLAEPLSGVLFQLALVSDPMS